MSPKKLILHVGLHKTATSSFQDTCGTNRDALTTQGLHYPQFRIDKRVTYNHSIPLFTLFSGRAERYKAILKWGYGNQIERVRAVFQKQLDAALAGHDHVLLSGEDISVLPREGMEALKAYLTAAGFELRVLCTVRWPYSYVCSHLQQQVRAGLLGDFRGVKIPRASLYIKQLMQCFEQAEFSSFERDCGHPEGPVGALLERLGVKIGPIEQAVQNEGLGNATTRLYAAINRDYPVLKEDKLNPAGRATQLVNFDDEKFLLRADELAPYRAQLDAENAKLYALLGEGFNDEDYPVSCPVILDLATAGQMLVRASNPPHVRGAVERFVLEYLDPAVTMDDLTAMVRTVAREAATPGSGLLDRAARRMRRIIHPFAPANERP